MRRLPMQIQGVLSYTLASWPLVLQREWQTVLVELPDAAWQRIHSRDGSTRPCSPSQAQVRSGFAHHDRSEIV